MAAAITYSYCTTSIPNTCMRHGADDVQSRYAKKTWLSASQTTHSSESQLPTVTVGITTVYYVEDGLRFTLLTVIFWKVECEAVKINIIDWAANAFFLHFFLLISFHEKTFHVLWPQINLPFFFFFNFFFFPSLLSFLSSNERQKAMMKSQKAEGCWCFAADDWQLMISSSCYAFVLQGWGWHLIGVPAFESQVNQLTFTWLSYHKLLVVSNGHSNGCGESSEWRIISIKP